MTLQEARKVIGLNIHNLNGSMQMAVATIMDALEEKAEIIGHLQPSEDLEEEIKRYLREECSGDDEPAVSEIASHFANWQKEQMFKEAVEDLALTWEDAKAGTCLPGECLIIYEDGDPRLGKVAINDCKYLPIEKLLPKEDKK